MAIPSKPVIVSARVLAAVVGSYGVAWSYTAFASRALWDAGLDRSNAVAWATLSSFILYLALALWSFVARSILRVWLTLLGASGILTIAAALLGRA